MKSTKLFSMILSLFMITNQITAQDSTKLSTPKKRMVVNNHPAQYSYQYYTEPYIEDFALGFDYQNEIFDKKLDWDESKHYQNSGGFNIYFMANSRLTRNLMSFGSINWGGGFAMNFQGDGSYEYVQMNTTNLDSAKTNLSVLSPQLYTFVRSEFKLGPFYPFIGLGAGVKWYSTSQNTETLVTLKDYESTTSDHITSTGSMYLAPEIGLRIRLTKTTSLVTSYSWVTGGELNLTDLNKSNFNSWRYNISTEKASLNVSQFKFGILFDLSERKSTKTLIKEAYSDTTFINEDEINSNTYPCPCCPKQNYNYQSPPSKPAELENPSQNNSTIRSYPSNSRYPEPVQPTNNSTKKPLPGIKPTPVIKPKS